LQTYFLCLSVFLSLSRFLRHGAWMSWEKDS
jgi:hypothetical protein